MASEFIGLDVGHVRTGFARGNDVARLSEPLKTVSTDEAVAELERLVKELDAKGVVVGLPRSLAGDETGQTAWVREWVDKAKAQIGTSFYWQDEALTSKVAESRKLVGKGLHDVDALAAAIILQDFLDTAEAERVVC